MRTARWPVGYRPLAPRTLLSQLGLLLVVEAALFASYRHHEAGFHWSTHFLVGLTTASAVLLGWLVVKGAPARAQLLWVLGMHAVAMFPDVLFTRGHQPHDEWMDVFLGHISAHYVPGGDVTWLAVALAASGAYCWTLSRWLAARRSEALNELAPGIGIGGSAIIRPQRSPLQAPLAHSRFGPPGPPRFLLLHGLGASRAVWREVARELDARRMSGLAVDLLGFDGSRGIGTEFGLAAQVQALDALLHDQRGERLTVVGHSFGCAVGVALADARPGRVERLVLVSPPAFRDGDRARERLAERGWLARHVVEASPVASFACGLMCLTRPVAARLVRRVAPDVPDRVALDSVQHSWPAYRDVVKTLLEDNPLPDAIGRPRVPTTVVVGTADTQAPADDVLDWPHDQVDVVTVDADHPAAAASLRCSNRCPYRRLLGGVVADAMLR